MSRLDITGVIVKDIDALISVAADAYIAVALGLSPETRSEVLITMRSGVMGILLSVARSGMEPTADAEDTSGVGEAKSVVLESCRIKVDSENVVSNVPDIETTPNSSVAGSTSSSVVIMIVSGIVAIVAPAASPSLIPIVSEGETTMVSMSRPHRVVL